MIKLPQGWEVKKLGEIGFFIRGVSYKKEQLLSTKNENSVYLLRANNIQNELNLDELQIIPKELVVDKIIQNNDILFAMSSGSKHIVGKNILLNNLNDFTFGAFCGLFRIINLNICHKFIAYYLRSDSYKNYIFNISKGSNINNLRFVDLEKFQIPLPPLKEQERIVGILDESFAKIDESIKILEQDLLNLDELMQSALQKAFNPLKDNTKENYKLPQGWEWKSLYEISNYGKTSQIKPSQLKSNDWILELEDIEKESGVLLRKVLFQDRQSKSNKIKFSKGDILFGTLRPYLKKVIIANNDGVCSSEIMPFSTDNFITNHFIYYYLFTNFLHDKISNLTYGSRMPRLGTKDGKSLQIPLPPLQEQEQIASHLDELSSHVKNLKQNYQAQIKDLQELKKSLLDKAFQGRL
ncbi:restriction endonuclease subunit S [Campylobacter sp. RKI_CA19_01128]|uniref:restriction endonuclease subunit S n=1 Tax=unclassified Campylobacter TaxID=2593542 RepID=UPI0021E763B6|nr:MULTISPECIES: restriction endonuclease subunit S [unclassified Campylobacter]MCV3348293.1 restriction endonuclease subunit S [Campylobacter sp. RKI_CA19_01127]MCV3354448.1 restriction endonuclease subunit S [Campylobacter sp. RKI_CA19_01128]HEC1775843.1 restriction endonuclease subunit S [Campylobacter lari]